MQTNPTCFHCDTPLAADDSPVHIGDGWGSVHCCEARECVAVLDALVWAAKYERALEEQARREEKWEREGGTRL